MLYRRLIFLLGILLSIRPSLRVLYNYFEKVVGKTVHATIPKGNMGYDQYTFLTLWLSNLLLLLSLNSHKHTSMACRATLSNFFEEQ